jgi:hypothetical protein
MLGVLVEGAWAYRMKPRIGRHKVDRIEAARLGVASPEATTVPGGRHRYISRVRRYPRGHHGYRACDFWRDLPCLSFCSAFSTL